MRFWDTGAMRVAVIGTGGVGAFLGGALIDAGAEVHLVSTPRHVQAVRERGLSLTTDEGARVVTPASVCVDPSGIGTVDVVLLTTKLYQLEDALEWLAGLVGPDTLVVTLQNGVSAPSMVAERFGEDHVVPGLAVIVAWVEGPGQVRRTGPVPGITIGSRPLSAGQDAGVDARCEAFVEAVRAGGLHADLAADVWRALWKKFSLITTMGGVNCLANATTGEVRAFAPTRDLMERSLDEVRAVANARGVALSRQDTEDVMAQLDGAAESSTTSMQRDLQAGHVSELPWLNATVVEMAAQAGVEVPFHTIATAVMSLFARRGHV